MKSTGMVRKTDELGRVVIPIELRRDLNIMPKDTVRIYVEEDSIAIEKYDEEKSSVPSIKRNTDELGRIVIPAEIRKRFRIDVDDTSLEIFVDNDRVLLKKYEPGCIFCGEISNTLYYKGKHVCKSCKDDIINI